VSSTKYTLDRYEGDYAIFLMADQETSQKIIHRSEMDLELAEGDIVLIDDAPTMNITLLQDETSAQKEKISNMIERLRNRQ
jgi:hypothetical protein